MNSNEQGRVGIPWFVVAIITFLAGVGWAVVATLMGYNLLNSLDDPPVFILGVAGVIALVNWWRDRTKRSAADESSQRERERLGSELEDAQRERERLESELEDREEALDRERLLRSRSEEAHRTEKNWRQGLHAEIMRVAP